MAELPDYLRKGIVFSVDGQDDVEVARDLTYKVADGKEWKMDVYSPPRASAGQPLPAVVFVHGDGPPVFLRDAKEWGQYTSWGRLVAASGLIGVTFNHRSSEGHTRMREVVEDIADLLSVLREQGPSLGIDTDRLCIWTCSAGTPFALTLALRDRPGYVRCIVSYYGIMDLQPIFGPTDSTVTQEALREYSPIRYLSNEPGMIAPMFVARAGQDSARLNDTIDSFVASALANNVTLDLMNHPHGQHAFDVLNDDSRSREIIARSLEFMRYHLITVAPTPDGRPPL